jgi:hypothetical protein
MFNKKKGELVIPPSAQKDREALELARIWAAEGAQHVTLRADCWEDPAAWGLMLVDLAQHLANAYQQMGWDRGEALARIRAGFEAEWTSPTDTVRGEILS